MDYVVSQNLSPVPQPGLRKRSEGPCEVFDSIPYTLSPALENFR